MVHKLEGAGLPHVYLRGGVLVEGIGDKETVAYADLDGLYFAIARAIALRSTPLTGAELRFMRKRLGMTQEQVGALGGKSGQVAAKWEKGALAVPAAEGKLVRLAWLTRHSRRDLSAAVERLTRDGTPSDPCGYAFVFDGQRWSEDVAQAQAVAREKARASTVEAIEKAMAKAKVTVAYTAKATARDFGVKPADPSQTEQLT